MSERTLAFEYSALRLKDLPRKGGVREERPTNVQSKGNVLKEQPSCRRPSSFPNASILDARVQ